MIGTENRKIRPGSHFKQVILWAVLASTVMLPRVLDLDVFVGPDELAELGRDNQFTLALFHRDLAGTLVGDGKPSVTLMWVNTIGVFAKWLWLQASGAELPFDQVIAPDRSFGVWGERRLFLALASGLQILAAWPLMRAVWNGRVASIGVGLMAIEPFLLAFTRMIRGDALLSGFMLLSILSALAYLKTGQYRYNCLSGVMGGLAGLTKFTGGITALIAAFLYAIVVLKRRTPDGQTGWQAIIRAWAGWGLAFAVVFFGLWPAWWVRPADTFNLIWGKATYHAVDAATQRAGLFFWGTFHPLGPGVWFYPVLVILRLTPWLLLGSILAVGRWLWQAIHLRSLVIDPNKMAVFLYVAVYWLAMTIPGQKIDRYILPVVPGLAVLTAIEIVNVAGWLKQRLLLYIPQPILPGIAAIGIGLVMAGHISVYHPLYSTYFDPVIGGPQFWQWALPVGQGEGVDTALKYLATLPDTAESTVVCGTNFPRCRPFFTGELWNQEDLRSYRWFEADYALLHIDEQQVGAYPEGVLNYLDHRPPIYAADYHGIDYTRLYAIPQPSFLTGGSKLEGVATLLGYDVEGGQLSALSAGDQLILLLYWQNEGQAAQQKFWWRIVDSQGYIWTEAMARPFPEFEVDAAREDAVVEGEVQLSLPPDMPPGTYYLNAGFADDRGDVGQFGLPSSGSVLGIKGPLVEASQPVSVPGSLLAPDLGLQGYDVSSTEIVPGEETWAILNWQAIGRPRHDYLIVLRLLSEAGEVASWSGRPFYDTFPTQQWPANASVRDPWRILMPDELLPGSYQLMLELRDASSSAEVAHLSLGTIQVVERRVNYEVPTMQFQADYQFDGVATLVGYDLLGDLLPDGARVRVTLYWRALKATEQLYAVRVRLTDAEGLVLAEQESQPAGGTIPTNEWAPGEIVADLHQLDAGKGAGGTVNLEVELRDGGGNAVPLTDGSGKLVISDVQQKVMWRVSAP